MTRGETRPRSVRCAKSLPVRHRDGQQYRGPYPIRPQLCLAAGVDASTRGGRRRALAPLAAAIWHASRVALLLQVLGVLAGGLAIGVLARGSGIGAPSDSRRVVGGVAIVAAVAGALLFWGNVWSIGDAFTGARKPAGAVGIRSRDVAWRGRRRKRGVPLLGGQPDGSGRHVRSGSSESP